MQLPLNGTELGYHSLLRRVTPDDERAILAFPTEVGKAEEGECFRLPFSPLFPVLGGKAPQLDQPRLFCIDFQNELRQPLLESFPEPFDIHSAFEADDQVSSAGGSHPDALSEPYVTLAAHTAPAMEPRRTPICQCAHGFESRRAIRATQCVALRR